MLTSEEAARAQVGEDKKKIEYMGTRRTMITLHEVLMNIEEYLLGAFFTKYGQEEDVS